MIKTIKKLLMTSLFCLIANINAWRLASIIDFFTTARVTSGLDLDSDNFEPKARQKMKHVREEYNERDFWTRVRSMKKGEVVEVNSDKGGYCKYTHQVNCTFLDYPPEKVYRDKCQLDQVCIPCMVAPVVMIPAQKNINTDKCVSMEKLESDMPCMRIKENKILLVRGYLQKSVTIYKDPDTMLEKFRRQGDSPLAGEHANACFTGVTRSWLWGNVVKGKEYIVNKDQEGVTISHVTVRSPLIHTGAFTLFTGALGIGALGAWYRYR